MPGKHQTEEVQKEFIEKMLLEVEKAKSSNGDLIVLNFDPMHQTHNNENGRIWQKKGKEGTKNVKSNTGRRRINILGAINMVNLDIVPFITEENCNKESIKIFLSEVKKTYPKAKEIKIFLDNARYQRNYEVQDYAKELGIILEFMPPYSPNLCLIERLWKFFKKKVVRNKYYNTFDEFYDFVCDFFSLENWEKMKPELENLLTLNFEII
ncbi:MAG: IS630 family transposase [Bacteroidales bacterium]|nr:IS630 family transposase [Bacteroidales bacterium]